MINEKEHIQLGNNTKRARFLRIAESRVNKILIGLENLGKCANTRNYEYSEQEVRKIFREIERKVKEAKLLFNGSSQHNRKFTL